MRGVTYYMLASLYTATLGIFLLYWPDAAETRLAGIAESNFFLGVAVYLVVAALMAVALIGSYGGMLVELMPRLYGRPAVFCYGLAYAIVLVGSIMIEGALAPLTVVVGILDSVAFFILFGPGIGNLFAFCAVMVTRSPARASAPIA